MLNVICYIVLIVIYIIYDVMALYYNGTTVLGKASLHMLWLRLSVIAIPHDLFKECDANA